MKPNTEIIEKYLLNTFSVEERKQFEEEVKKNPELKKELETQKKIMEGVDQAALKQEIKQGFKKAKINKLIKTVTTITLFVAIIATGSYYLSKNVASKNKSPELKYELNEKGEANWSDADKFLESQVFKIDSKHDTIIETKNGIIFQLKAGTFLNKFGEVPTEPVELEVKEAMTAADIIKAGLSTTSNGELLETGGMFYINGRSGKENLTIDQNKPIKTHVPSSTDKKMNLYDGERLKDGSINWINPKQMRRQLSTVNILKLDFYPPHFIDSLRRMGFDVKNKKLTDSIYYSFSNFYKCESEADTYSVADSAKSISEFDDPNVLYSAVNNYSFTNRPIALTASSSGTQSAGRGLGGEQLFRLNCSPCHYAHTDQKLTGPGLKGMMNRVPGGDWLMRYIMNNERLIKAGDSYANKIYNENGKAAMTVFEGQLTESDVNSIIKYISGTTVLKKRSTKNECIAEINPSRIRAIWDPKFNNTIIATKQFEERLKVIFTTCNVDVFNLYVENLGADLSELDSAAAYMVSGEQRDKFLEFYKKREGGVEISNEQDVYLQNYVKAKKEIYDKAVADAMAEMYTTEFKKQMEALDKSSKYYDEFNKKQSGLLDEEVEKNIDEAYRQIGKVRPPKKPIGTYLDGIISTPGWKNVDVPFVPLDIITANTMQRATIDVTTVATQQRIVIEYKEAVVNVKDREKYDRIVCYLLPDKLSSFQLMKENAKGFSEKMNMTFQNSIITVGYKGDKTYYNDIQYAKPQNYEVDLKEIDSGVLIGRLNSRYSVLASTDMIKSIDFSLFEQKEKIRTDKIKKREEVRNRLYNVVYPCAPQVQPVAMGIIYK